MPNYCDYAMKVIGQKHNVEEFIKIIKADYNYYTNKFGFDRHLFRVFEAEVISDEMQGITRIVEISGYCAWSVHTCMLEGEHTYYNDRLKESINYGTSLLQESKRLGLIIEVYSLEPGMCFQEHYLIHNNQLLADECVDYCEYYIDDINSYQEFVDRYGNCDDIDEAKFNQAKNGGVYSSYYIESGGFGDWPYKYSNFDIMAKTLNRQMARIVKK